MEKKKKESRTATANGYGCRDGELPLLACLRACSCRALALQRIPNKPFHLSLSLSLSHHQVSDSQIPAPYIHTYIHTCIHTYIYIYIYTSLAIPSQLCLFVAFFLPAKTQTQTHTHTHTRSLSLSYLRLYFCNNTPPARRR